MLVEGATYAVNPEPAFVPPTSNDLALHRDAVYRMRFEEFFDAACRGAVDRMFLSGGQIDAYGNTNVTAIGGMPHPKIKLGGGGGGANISATIGALTVWTTRHGSGRTLVETVDFLTDLGHRTPGRHPRRARAHRRRPAVARHRARGPRLHRRGPRPARRDVPRRQRRRRRAGHRLRRSAVADEVGTVPDPTPAELAAVRAVDPLGVRRLEFGPADLARRFGPAA